MNSADFVSWAMDDARSVEERYCVELLVERCLGQWRILHNVPNPFNINALLEKKRQRKLNPAYQPQYTAEQVRCITEIFPTVTSWEAPSTYDDRPLRDFKALRFLPNLASLGLGGEFTDLSPLLELAALRSLNLYAMGCEDYAPLARCHQLRELHLSFGVTWPEVKGLENLTGLEALALHGNLLVFERGVVFPNVVRGALACKPLAARSARDLPQLPACRLLTLSGVEKLDGIEAFTQLRNLNIESEVRDFAPLALLPELTALNYSAAKPLDVAPLVHVPRLLYAAFTHNYKWDTSMTMPRDYAPLAESNSLRQVEVPNCEPVKMEVATLNAVLPPWDDLFARPEPRPLTRLRIISAGMQHHPRREGFHFMPGEASPLDERLRKCEARWVAKRVERAVTKRLGMSEWGHTSAQDVWAWVRRFELDVESFAVVERLGEVMEAARSVLAGLQADYQVNFCVRLKAPPLELTSAQKKLQEQFNKEQEEFDSEKRQRERAEYLDRLHRFQLKKQEGGSIKPEEFSVPPPPPRPDAPWEREEESDEDDDGGGESFVAMKEKPEPPPFWRDDDHPLADNYRMYGVLTLDELWVQADAGLITFTFGRGPDEVIETEQKGG